MHLFKKILKYCFLSLLLVGVGFGMNSASITAVDDDTALENQTDEEKQLEDINTEVSSVPQVLAASNSYQYSNTQLGISFDGKWQNNPTIDWDQQFTYGVGTGNQSKIIKSYSNKTNLYHQINTITITSQSADTIPYYVNNLNVIAVNNAQNPPANDPQSFVKLSNNGTNFFYGAPFNSSQAVDYSKYSNQSGPSKYQFSANAGYSPRKQNTFNIYMNPNQQNVTDITSLPNGGRSLLPLYYSFEGGKTGSSTAKIAVNFYFRAANAGIVSSNGAIVYTGTPTRGIPQVTKVLHRDAKNPTIEVSPEQIIGKRKAAGGNDTGKYLEPLKASKISKDGYKYINYQVLVGTTDSAGNYTGDTVALSSDDSWEGTLNTVGTTRRYIIFYYEKEPDTATIEKTNNKEITGISSNASDEEKNVTYTLKVTNTSNHELTNLNIKDTLPSGMSAPNNVLLNGNVLNTTSGSLKDYYNYNSNKRVLNIHLNNTVLQPNETINIMYNSKVDSGVAGTSKTNNVSLFNKEGLELSEDSSSFKITEKLTGTLTKTNNQPDPIGLNQLVTYTLKATNTSQQTDIAKPYIEDTLPNALTEPKNVKLNSQLLNKTTTSTGNYYTWNATTHKLTIYMNGTTLKSNQTATVTYESTPSTLGTLTNNAELFLADKTSLAKASSTIKVVETKGSITKTNDQPNPILAGTNVTYTVKPKNDSAELILKKFKLEDTLPIGLDEPTMVKVGNTSLSNQFSTTTDYYSWDASNRKLIIHFNQTQLGPNQTTNVTYVAKVSKDATVGTKENTVVLKDINDNTLDTSSSTITVFESLNGLIKKNNNKEQGAIVNDLISYTLVATNTSSFTDLSKGYIYDILPSELGEPTNIRLNGVPLPEYDVNLTGQVKDAYTWLAADRKLIIHINGTDIQPNESITVEYDTQLLSGTPGTPVINTATLYTSSNDKLSEAQSRVPILQEAISGSLEKENNKSDTGAAPGDVVNYTVNAMNTTQSITFENSIISDDLPQGMELPTSVQLNKVELSNIASSTNDYYTIENNTRMTIHLNKTTVKPGKTITITYQAKLIAGTIDELKTNTAEWRDAKNEIIDQTESSFEVLMGGITGDIEKTNSKLSTGARINDTVGYTLVAKNTSPNADLIGSYIYDILPAELEQPTNIQLVLLDENGNEVAGSKKVLQLKSVVQNKDDAYSWVKADRKLIIHINGTTIKPNQAVKVTYDAKVLSGKENQAILNTATFYADNPQKQLDKDTSTFKIKVVRINLKQEAIYPNFSNRNYRLVMPTTSYFTLDNIDLQTKTSFSCSTITASSYAENTNGAYRKMQLILASGAQGIIPSITIPEFYQYAGYQVTTTNVAHNSANRIQTGLPTLDYTNTDEYWVTMYIKPDDWIKPTNEEVEPPMYNWDYATNKFN